MRNSYKMCEECPYAEYIGLGQVGCYAEKPPCLIVLANTENEQETEEAEDCV